MRNLNEPPLAQIVRDFFRDVDNQDWDSMISRVHQDVSYERPGYSTFNGREDFLRFYRHERVVKKGVHKIERIFESDNECICIGSFIGSDKSGRPLSARFIDTFLFCSLHIQNRRTYFFSPLI